MPCLVVEHWHIYVISRAAALTSLGSRTEASQSIDFSPRIPPIIFSTFKNEMCDSQQERLRNLDISDDVVPMLRSLCEYVDEYNRNVHEIIVDELIS